MIGWTIPPPQLVTAVGGKVVPFAGGAAATSLWGELIPLDELRKPPAIDLELFPPVIEEFTRAVADNVCLHHNLAAAFALGILAIANTKKLVNVRAGWTEPLCLYVAGVGRSGSGKTPMLKPYRRPIDTHQRDFNDLHGVDIRNRADDIKNWEAQKARAINPRKGEKPIHTVAELNNLLENNPPLFKKCLYLGDATSEAITDAIIEQGGKLGLLSGEPTMFDILAGMYSERPNLDLVTNAYDGDPVHSRRKKDGQKDIEHAYLSIALGVQTERVLEMLANKRLRDSGVMPRFCYIVQPELYIDDENAKPIPADVEAQFNGLIYRLLNASENATDNYILYLSDEAQKVFRPYINMCKWRVMEDNEWEYWAEWGSKHAGRALRIAANFHTCLHLDPREKLIDSTTMQAAIALSEQLAEHATYLFRKAETPSSIKDALYLWGKIKAINATEISKSELTRKVQGKVEFKLNDSLAVLVERGYIRVTYSQTGNAGRPSETIFVNPETNVLKKAELSVR